MIESFFNFTILILPSSHAKYKCFPTSYEFHMAAVALNLDLIVPLSKFHSNTWPLSPVVISLLFFYPEYSKFKS